MEQGPGPWRGATGRRWLRRRARRRLTASVLTVALIVTTAPPGYAAFSLVGVGLATGGDKDGGLAWGDFDNDGCLDVAVNTNDGALGTRLYRSDCGASPTFTDVTAAQAAQLGTVIGERSIVWGDLENDGDLDLVRTTTARIEVWLNAGNTPPVPYRLGTPAGAPSQVITTTPIGFNVEGAGLLDHDADGDLDLVVDNHDDGIVIFGNDGTGTLSYIDPTTLGLPGADTYIVGDYLAVTDFDVDGDVDILARKDQPGLADLYRNDGGTFTALAPISTAPNANKGGVAFCDLDSDGDFDLFWTDGGTVSNVVFEQDPIGTFTATTEPTGVTGDIDDVVCGDVDNDGDLDLFLTSDGADQLFENTTAGGVLSFSLLATPGLGTADGEGAAFADYDRDGDLDLLVNQDGGNELWRNDANDGGADDYLMVVPRTTGGGAALRAAIGATVQIADCLGTPLTGVRELNGGRGHGTQDPAQVHFGLPNGPDVGYRVITTFVGGTQVTRAVVPSTLGAYQELFVADTDPDDLTACTPDLTVQKSDALFADNDLSGLPSPGDELEYTITIENTGGGPASAVQLADTPGVLTSLVVGSVTTDVGVVTTGNTAGDTDVVVDVGVLGSGVTATITFRVLVDDPVPDTTTVVANQATVTSTQLPALVSDDPATPAPDDGTETIVSRADLVLSKVVDDATPDRGQQVTFTVTLTNDGPQSASNVTVTDVLPAGLAHVSDSPSQGTYTPGTGVWDVGTLTASSSATLLITADVLPAAVGGVTNVAEVTTSDQLDPDSTPNNNVPAEDDQDSVDVTPNSADLSVTLAVSDATPNVGDAIDATVTVSSAGPDPVDPVVVALPMPAGLAAGAPTTITQGTYDAGTGDWTLGPLASGVTHTLVVPVTVGIAAVGGVVLDAELTTAAPFDPDSVPGNGDPLEDDQQQATITPLVADLSVGVTVDDPTPDVGALVTFTVTLTNAGPDPASDVDVTVTLPPGTTYDSSSASAGTFTPGTGLWELASHAGAATLDVTVAVGVGAVGGSDLVAEVTAVVEHDPDSTPNNNVPAEDDQGSATITPLVADLELTHGVSDPTPNVGDTVTFTVTLTNTGPDIASGLVVSEVLPGGLVLDPLSVVPSQGGYDAVSGEWTVGSLAAAQSATLTLDATVTSFDPADTTVVAELIASDRHDPDSVPNNAVEAEDDQETVVVNALDADLSVVVAVDDPAPNVGDTVTFTVTVANAGPDDAPGIFVTDGVPAGLTPGVATASQGAYDPVTGIWSVGTIAAAANATLSIPMTVDAAAVGGATYSAEVTASGVADPDSTPNSNDPVEDDQDAATVTPRVADLSLALTPSTAAPDVGDTITLTVDVVNAGPQTANGTQVAVGLPAGLTLVAASSSATQGTFDEGTGTWTVGAVTIVTPAQLSFDVVVDAAAVTGADAQAEVTAVEEFDPDSSPLVSDPAEDDHDVTTITAASADLSLASAVTDLTPEVGDTISVTYTLTNAGPDLSPSVSVDVVVPAGLTVVGDTSSAGAFAGSTWTVGDMAAFGSETLTLDLAVDPLATAGVDVLAEVSIAARFDPDSTPGNAPAAEDDLASDTITAQAADLELTVAATDTTPDVGDLVQVTFTLASLGPQDGVGVDVTTSIPAGLTVEASTASSGTYAGGVWSLPVVDQVAPPTLTLDVRVGAAAVGGVDVGGEVTASTRFDPDATAGNGDPLEDDQAAVTINPLSADLELAVTALPGAPRFGETVTLTVTVDNLGPDEATGVTVLAPLPAGFTYVAAVPGPPAFDPVTGIWNVGTVAATGTQVLTLTADADVGGPASFEAEVTASDRFDPDSSPAVSDPVEDDHDLTPLAVDLPSSIAGRVFDDRSGDGADDPGEPGLSGVELTLFTDPDGDGDPSDGVAVGTDVTGGSGDYSFGSLARGDYVVVVTIPPPPPFAPTTPTSVPVALPAATDATAPPIGFWQAARIDVSVFDDADGSGIRELGEGPRSGVGVQLFSDPNGDGDPFDDGAFLTAGATDAAGNLSFTSLPEGNYVVDVVDPVDTVLTTANDPAAVTLVPGAAVPLEVGFQDTFAALSASGGGTATGEAADTVAYAHLIRNDGNDTDTFDLAGATTSGWIVDFVVDVDGDGLWDPVTENVLVTDTGPLAPGDTIGVLALVRIDPAAARRTVDVATVTVTSQFDPAIGAGLDSTTTVIAPVVDVLMTAPAPASLVVPGAAVPHRVEVSNLAPDPDVAIARTVSLDAVLADPTHGAIDDTTVRIDGVLQPAGTAFPLTLGDIVPGATVVVEYDVVLSRPLPDGTGVTSLATATASNAAGDPLTDFDNVTTTVSSEPIGQLTLVADPPALSTVDPATTITYTMSVTNRADATDEWNAVEVVLDLPSGDAAYVPGSATVDGASVPDAAGGTNPFAFGEAYVLAPIAPGQVVTIEVQVRVADPPSDGATLTALAIADGSNDGPFLASVSHTVDVRPGVAMAADRSSTIEPPASAVYPHRVDNTGNATDDVRLVATNDRGWAVRTVADLDGDGLLDTGEPVIASTGPLPAGTSARILVVVDVPAGAASGTVGTTTVTARSQLDPAVLATNFDVTSVVAGQLAVSKTSAPSSSAINPGQRLTYTVVVRNPGTAPSRTVVLVDDLPATVRYRAGSARLDGVPIPDAPGGGNPFASGNGGVALGDLAAGASVSARLEVDVLSPLPDNTLVVNVATATGAGGLSASDSVSQLVTTAPVLDAALTASPAAPGPVQPGGTIRYTLRVGNVGNVAATSVTATSALPAGATYVGGSTTRDGAPVSDVGGTSPLFGGGVDLGTVAVGATRSTSFSVVLPTAAPPSSVSARGSVTSAEGVSATSPTLTHQVDTRAGGTLTAPPPLDVEAPGRGAHPLTLTNTGNADDAFSLRSASTLGWATTFFRDDDANGIWDEAVETTTVAVTPALSPGASFPFFAVVDVPAGTTPGSRDVTTVTAASNRAPTTEATTTVRTRATAPELVTVLSATPSGATVNSGATITYVMTVRNRGSAPAVDVTLVNDTPTDTTYEPGSAVLEGGSIPDAAGPSLNPFDGTNGGVLVGTLAPGQLVSARYTVRVLPVGGGTVITDTATASALATPPSSATKVHTVAPGPVLDISATSVPAQTATVTASEVITYTLLLTNPGEATATGVRLVADTPVEGEFVVGSATVDGLAVPDGPTDPNPFSSVYGGRALPDLPNDGATITVVFAARVLDPVLDGREIQVVGEASADGGLLAVSAPITHVVDVSPAPLIDGPFAANVSAGTAVVVRHLVTNAGDVSDAFDLAAVVDAGWVATVYADRDADGILGTGDDEIVSSDLLPPGSSQPVLVEAQVPAGAVAGSGAVLRIEARSTIDDGIASTVDDALTVVAGRLSLVKAASPLSLTPGDPSTYTLTVTNAGSAPVTGVRLVDATPAGTTYVPGSARRDGVAVPDAPGGGSPLEPGLAIGTLAPSASTVVRFDVVTGADPTRTVVVNSAEATAADAATARAGTVQPVSVRYAVDISAGSFVLGRPGETIVLPHTVTNGGDVDDEIALSVSSASGWSVSLVEDLDADGVLDAGEGLLASATELSPFGSLAVLAVLEVPVDAAAGASDDVTITATSVGDPSVAVAAVDVVLVEAAALRLSVASSPPATVEPGQRLTFLLDVFNDGSAPATSLVLRASPPAGTEFAAATLRRDGAAIADDVASLTPAVGGLALGDLPGGTSTRVTVDIVVPATLNAGSVLTLLADVSGVGLQSVTGDTSVTVIDRTAIDVTKSSEPASAVIPGSSMAWFLAVRNAGTTIAPSVIVADTLPAGMAFIPGSVTVDGVVASDDLETVGIEVGPIAPGETRTIRFEALVEDLPDGTTIQNSATVRQGAGTTPVVSNVAAVVLSQTGEAGLPTTGFSTARTLQAATALIVAGWALLYVARPAPMSRRRP